jgi:hypothetical protein
MKGHGCPRGPSCKSVEQDGSAKCEGDNRGRYCYQRNERKSRTTKKAAVNEAALFKLYKTGKIHRYARLLYIRPTSLFEFVETSR